MIPTRPAPVRDWSHLALAVLPLIAAACTNSQAPVPEAALGRYPLVTVNGQALPQPHTVSNGCVAIFGSGHLDLLTRTTFLLQLNYGYSCPDESTGQDALVLSGTFRQSRQVLSMNAGATRVSGQLDGDFITVNFSDVLAVLWNAPVFRMGPREDVPAP